MRQPEEKGQLEGRKKPRRPEEEKKVEEKEHIGKRIHHWEVLITVVIALTIWIGKSTNYFWPSLLFVVMEIIIAIVLWTVKTLSDEVHAFRTDFSEQVGELRKEFAGHDELLGYVGKLHDPTILQSLNKITSNLTKLSEYPLLLSIMKRELKTTADRFSEAGAGATLIDRTRKRTRDTQEVFDHYMSALEPGSEYDTVSNLDFWSTRTLNKPLDLLYTNVEAAKRGVAIVRIFLLPRDTRKLTAEETLILEAHERASKESAGHLMSLVSLTDQNDPPDNYGNYGLCRTPDGSEILLEMYYTGVFGDKDREFERMEIVRDEYKIATHRGRFKRLLGRVIGIPEFLAGIQEPASTPDGARG